MGKNHPAEQLAREYQSNHPGVSMTKARELSQKQLREQRPNHYYYDSLGDPATCTENHNHPRRGDEPAMNEICRNR